MAAPSNINPQDRLAALRSANKALDALDAIHSKWILWKKTRPAATALKQVNDHLRVLVAALDDSTADLVAHDLGIIITQLMVVDELKLIKPIFDISVARQKILGQQN
jgi:hypothetical protein